MLKRLPAILCILLALGVGFGLGYIYGYVKGAFALHLQVYLTQQEAIEPVLASDPAYAGVEVCMASRGHAYLMGRVPSEEVHRRLRQEMVRLFGEPFAETLMNAVVVKGPN
jgi:hypothetical protein